MTVSTFFNQEPDQLCSGELWTAFQHFYSFTSFRLKRNADEFASESSIFCHKEEEAQDKKPEESDSSKSNSEVDTVSIRDWKIQLLFDTVYLAHMLGDSTQLADVAGRVQKSAEPSPDVLKVVQKMSKDYWKRTELLFGLLAVR